MKIPHAFLSRSVALALLGALAWARPCLAVKLTASEFDAPSDRGSSGNYRTHQRPAGRSYYNGESRHDLGLGLMLGEPTGLNLKVWLTRESALQFGLSYSFNNYFSLIGDYLYHFPAAFASSRGGSQFVPYLGLGMEAFFLSSNNQHGYYYGTNSSFDLGVLVPLGIEFLPHHTPLGIWVELAPGVGLVPATFGFVQAVIGIRFYI